MILINTQEQTLADFPNLFITKVLLKCDYICNVVVLQFCYFEHSW